MITFTILLVAILSMVIATVLVVLAGGAGIILALGDVFVCGLIIYLIVKIFRRRK